MANLKSATKGMVVEVIYEECRKKGYTGMLLVQFMSNDRDFKVEDKDGVIGLGRWNANGSLNLIIGKLADRTKEAVK